MILYHATFNRTSMELKHVVKKREWELICLLLIEPVWN